MAGGIESSRLHRWHGHAAGQWVSRRSSWWRSPASPIPTSWLYSATPALMYFFFVYMQVHFYAKRNGLLGSPAGSLPPVFATFMAGWYFLIPVAVIVGGIFLGYSLAYIALMGHHRRRCIQLAEQAAADGSPRQLRGPCGQALSRPFRSSFVAGPVSINRAVPAAARHRPSHQRA